MFPVHSVTHLSGCSLVLNVADDVLATPKVPPALPSPARGEGING